MFQFPVLSKARRWLCRLLPVVFLIFQTPAQSILREYWLGIEGDSVADLTNNLAYPHSPTGRENPVIFEGPINWADDYGARYRGYVTAPTTGNYTFYIAGDNQCELWVSTNDLPANRRLVARVLTWTGSRVWQEARDGNAAAQRSALINLVAGRKYYIEALQKEGGTNDCLAVGWTLPSATQERPIPASRLSPFLLPTNAPAITSQPVNATVYEGQEVRFTVVANGMEPLTYLWQRDGADMPIQRSATLILPVAHLEDSGARFRCLVANPKGELFSSEAILTVQPEIASPYFVSVAPEVSAIVRELTRIEVIFSEPVSGVDAADVLINGSPATNVTGVAAGPYVFTFPPAASGFATISFAANHGIKDLSVNQNVLPGGDWTVTVNPNLPAPKIRISEISASNETGLLDEDGEAHDWIEIENFGATAVNLNGWSLSDDSDNPGQWIFPNLSLNAGQRLVVFASGKDRRFPTGGARRHTNFLLGEDGEFLGLFDAGSPRALISGFDPYPEQRVNHSYGLDTAGVWKYFATPTPGAANGTSSIIGILPPPHFSSERGFFAAPFEVILTTDVPGAEIRYTRNGSDPSGAAGILYSNALPISATTVLRASVRKTNYLPSFPKSHTFLYNIIAARRTLPALSIVTPTNNLTGPTGIIGISGGNYNSGVWQAVNAGDYHNPSKHGIAWERPTSVEFFFPTNNAQFQADCGIRVQGSDYIRPRYTTGSKLSYRLYFCGDYGPGQLEFPLFENGVTEYDQIVLRAGHNDDTNPFIKDELMRRLFLDTGQAGAHGNFVTLYVNGVYKGYYNVTERIEKHFMQDWHGGEEEWDVIEQGPLALDGDNSNFNTMVNFFRNNSMTNSNNYLEGARRLDYVNFIDYLLVNIYGANGDWPQNNWRAARERSANGIWRYYIWDAEFALGTYGKAVDWNEFANEMTQTQEIPTIYQRLFVSPEFKLLFADRINKHFYNGGALVDTNILRQFTVLKNQMSALISGFDISIQTSWIPNRRRHVTNHFNMYGLAGALGAPVFSQFGGRVPSGYQLNITSPAVAGSSIYYTTNGTDPRVMFTSAVSPAAKKFTPGQPITLTANTRVKARVLTPANAWTALTEAVFEVSEFGAPLRFTEINYNPPGGDAYEFVELKNFSATTIDLSGMSMDGIDFRFPENTHLLPGEFVVLASDANPTAFASRYPAARVTGYFDNSLSNGGERISLLDKLGNIVAWVDYRDDAGWPVQADGGGYSLELFDRETDPNSPAAWRKSATLYGSAGSFDEPSAPASLILNEIVPTGAAPGWIELYNPGATEINLANYSLGDTTILRRFIFPNTAIIPPGQYFVTNYNIPATGGTLFLLDATTNRLDAVTFARVLPGHSLSRIDGIWTLGNLTAGAANTPATLAPASQIILNEWLANPVSGADDWIELHNTGDHPAPLQGLTLSVSNALYRIPTLGFIPAHGFVQLFASEKSQPYHLALKLPSIGAPIRLYDPNGVQINSVSYTAQTEAVSEGRLPDGGATIAKFRGSLSPGASNYVINVTSPLVINEVMARNVRSIINPFGELSDWIELYNSGPEISLGGVSLSDNYDEPGQWTFPPNLTLASGQYLIVWFDKTHAPTTNAPFNTGKALSADGGGVYLFNSQGQVIDQIEFGLQAADLPIGRVSANWTLLSAPTPGAPNTLPINLSAVAAARINEWAPDWIELHNTTSLPVALGGMTLTDDLSLLGQKKFIFPALSFLGPLAFARWDSGAIGFQASPDGESLRLYNSSLAVSDTVSFSAIPDGGALARIPNGSGPIVASAQTPAEANYTPIANVAISKIIPNENRVEIKNLANAPLNLAGWTLSDDPLTPAKQTLAAITIPPFGLQTLQTTFALDPVLGGQIALSRTATEQVRLSYGPAVSGIAYRGLRTSLGAQSIPSPASGVVIREIMYHPEDGFSDYEYIELHNPTPQTISLANWRINGGVQYNFPPTAQIAPNEALVLVAFDPDANMPARLVFHDHYELPLTKLTGPFRGKLANNTDTIQLERPLPATPQGFIPHLIVDALTYTDDIPWPIIADGSGSALHRISANDIANEPFNWIAGTPSPGSAAELRAPLDRDADTLPDLWEIAYGLDIYNAADAEQDLDQDGLSNRLEYQRQTDPTSPSNDVELTVQWIAGNPNLQFVIPAGQTFHVQFMDDLNAAAWQPHSSVGPFQTDQIATIPILAQDVTKRFYRVAR